MIASPRDGSPLQQRGACDMTLKSEDRDTTISDIHQTRRRIAEKFGHDLSAIVEDAKNRQASSGHTIWRPSPKPSTGPESAAS
jgi:hypothetical protein